MVPGIGRRLLGSASAGTGLLGFGANTAIKLGAGNLAGGASLSAGALSALGLGATAGGIAGGASLISGGFDLYKGFTSKDKDEAAAYKESGAWKVGGVGAGAAAGAALGSVILGENLQSHFGDVKLSMQEIQDIARKMTFGDNIEAVTKFSDASAEVEQTYSNMEAAISNMDKLNWKASLGLKFDDADTQEYLAGVDAMIQSATDYIESKHYEAKTAIDLLIEPNSDVDVTTGLNTVYASLQEQINSLGNDLTAKVNVALEDGVITLDEQAEITNLQNQITEITQKVSDIQTWMQILLRNCRRNYRNRWKVPPRHMMNH